jgi:hypothetical protein
LSIFSGAYTHHFVDGGDEDLSVSDYSGARASHDGIQDLLHLLVASDYGQQQLGMKVHFVLASPINFGVALLPPETDHFGERKPFNPDVGKALPYLVQTSLPDNGIDPFHCGPFLVPTLWHDLKFFGVKSA